MHDLGTAEIGRKPQARPHAASSACGDAPTGRGLAGVRVLLVEDDAASRDALAFVLSAYGARVAGASDAREARRYFAESPPTVIVSDIGLPGEDGCAFLRWVRAQEGTAGHTLAIAISGFPAAEAAVSARAAGFDHFFAKPVDPLVLVRVINDASADSD